MATTTLMLATGDMHSVYKVLDALGARIVDQTTTEGACGYRDVTIETDEPAVADVLDIEDVTDKLYLTRYYGKGETETHDFELADTFGSGLHAIAKNKTTGARGAAYVSIRPIWEAVCEAAAANEKSES